MKFCPQCQQSFSNHERVCPADGALLSLPDPYHLIGRIIAEKYRLDALIGIGGMGAVYCAQHLMIDRRVAVKVLQPNLALGNERVVELFEREARTAGRLHHENIAYVMDAGRTLEGLAYIVIEWIDGVTLLDEMAVSGQFSFERTARVLRQIAAALTAAHEQSVIHRDLKPANVMLVNRGGDDEQVKVLDFGIAKIAGDTAAATISAPMGTPHYASPEQFRAGGQIDWRSDIYSLGVMLYLMLTGEPPFNASSVQELISLQMTAPPPSLRRLRPDAPLAVEQLIHRLLAKDPAERPQQAADIPALFERALGSANSVSLNTAGIDPSATQNLTELAEPQQVAFQREVTPWNLPTQLDPVPLTDLGLAQATTEQPNPKNLHRTVLVIGLVVLILGAALIGWWWNRSSQSSQTPRSIAVLPFKPLVAEGREESFEMGMAESLILKLGSLRQAQVRPLTAVRKFARLDQDPVAAGRELQVEAVLDGNIQKAGERVRVTARLLRVSDGAQLWADNFDLPLTDIFAVQDAIAGKVAKSLALTLSGAEQRQLSKHETPNMEAYQLYLQGRHQWRMRTPDGFNKGIEYFNQALNKDPNYAPAYAGLAASYSVMSLFGFLPPRDVMPKAEAMAQRALQLDESLAEAHAALGGVRAQYDWNWPAAERELQRAIELNPSLSDVRQYYALGLAAQGQFAAARAELQRAREFDPGSLNLAAAEGWIAYLGREYEQAMAQAQSLVALHPNFYPAQQNLGQACVAKGFVEQALPHLRLARTLSGNSVSATARLGHAYAVAGRKNEIGPLLAELQQSVNGAYGIAWIHLGSGERELALQWLRKAADDRAGELIYLKVDQLYDPLRSDQRFNQLLQRIGLTP